jgi:hypothetical protein
MSPGAIVSAGGRLGSSTPGLTVSADDSSTWVAGPVIVLPSDLLSLPTAAHHAAGSSFVRAQADDHIDTVKAPCESRPSVESRFGLAPA